MREHRVTTVPPTEKTRLKKINEKFMLFFLLLGSLIQ
jgi:hypothetical protein